MADQFNILDKTYGGLVLPVAQVTNDRTFLQAGATAAPGSSAALGTGSLRLSPMLVPNQLTISHLGCDISVVGDAGSTFVMAVYGNTSFSGRPFPGSLLGQATGLGDSATVQEIAFGTPLTLAAGLYWCGGVVQNVTVTQPTVRTLSSAGMLGLMSGSILSANGQILGFSQTGVTSTLPASFTQSLTSAGLIPRLHFRLA